MSKLFNKSRGNDLALAVDAIDLTVKEQGDALSNRTLVGQLVSMESLPDHELDNLSHQADDVAHSLRASLEGMVGFEDLTDAQVQAGVVTLMAAGDVEAYARAGYRVNETAPEGATLVGNNRVGSHGSLDYRATPSMESFDERELRQLLPFSVAYNIQAARQDAFGEAFYPTAVITPDQAGLSISVRRSVVFNAVRHSLTGRAVEMKRRNLLEASVDHRILADESTTVVPHIAADNSNADKFAPASDVAPTFRVIDNVSIATAPLRVNTAIDMLGISQHPGLIGANVMDITDDLDRRISLTNLYLKVESDVIALKVDRLPTSTFLPAPEGGSREMVLNFRSSDIHIKPDVKTVDGSAATSLATMVDGGYSVRLNVRMSGNADLETGNLEIVPGSVSVAQVFNKDGQEESITSGVGKQIAETFAAGTISYFDVFATRSNLNRRTQGLLVDAMEYTEVYLAELGAPISTPIPVSSTRDSAALTPLVTASRLRTSNNAVTTLLNYADTLKAVVGDSQRRTEQIPQIEGIGRFMVTPFFEERILDLPEVINSVTSHERAADVKAVLIDAIRDISYRMHRDSGYQAALDSLTGTAGQLPELVIGTDSILIQHMDVQGDPRTAGIGFKHRVVGSSDSRMTDTIVLTFNRTGAKGVDVLSSGVHAWMPELTSTLQVSRNGATIKEVMVQPRSRHINTLPVMAIIKVKGLSEALTGKVKTPALAISPEFAELLDGHKGTDGVTP